MTDQETILRLLNQGLNSYGLGRVDEALQSWRRVLLLDPGNEKAKEYIKFVQENWSLRESAHPVGSVEIPTQMQEAIDQASGKPQPSAEGGDAIDLVAGGALSMVEVGLISSPEGKQTLLRGAQDLLELDDFSGALELLGKILQMDPDNALASKMRSEAERELLSILSSKLGDLNQVPEMRMPEEEIIWLNLDHRAGFVLSLVDGKLSYDEILSVCGLSLLEGVRILVQLLQEKVIKVS